MEHITCRFYDGAKGNIYAVRPANLSRDKYGNIVHRGDDQWRRPRTTAEKDTELLAPYRCRIDHAGTMAGTANATWGILVKALMLEGPFKGDSFLVAHLNAATVKVGQVVEAGAVIGYEGWTGHTIPAGPGGKHSHIEHLVGTSFTPKDPSALLGIPKVNGVEFINDYRLGKQEEDNMKYRLYMVDAAYEGKESAVREFERRVAAGERVGFDRGGSDGRYRLGHVVMAVDDPAQLLDQLDHNYFIG